MLAACQPVNFLPLSPFPFFFGNVQSVPERGIALLPGPVRGKWHPKLCVTLSPPSLPLLPPPLSVRKPLSHRESVLSALRPRPLQAFGPDLAVTLVMGGSYAIHQGFSAKTFWSHSLMGGLYAIHQGLLARPFGHTRYWLGCVGGTLNLPLPLTSRPLAWSLAAALPPWIHCRYSSTRAVACWSHSYGDAPGSVFDRSLSAPRSICHPRS